MLTNVFDTVKYVVIPESQHSPAITFKALTSRFIILAVAFLSVLGTIQLHNDARCRTGEINDVACDWNLPLEG